MARQTGASIRPEWQTDFGKGGSRNDPERNRYGCFLPDLTGLATTPSARLPRRIWGSSGAKSTTLHIVTAARHSDGEAVERLAGPYLAGNARVAGDVEGPVAHFFLLLACPPALGDRQIQLLNSRLQSAPHIPSP